MPPPAPPLSAKAPSKNWRGSGRDQPGSCCRGRCRTFYARQIDPVRRVDLPARRMASARQVTAPPGGPVLESVSPESGERELPSPGGRRRSRSQLSIYPSADCAGALVAGGSGAQLGSGGIQDPSLTTPKPTFSAPATIPSTSPAARPATSSRSSTVPLLYQEVPRRRIGRRCRRWRAAAAVAGLERSPGDARFKPPPPPHLRTIPGGWANDNTPLVTGNATGCLRRGGV